MQAQHYGLHHRMADDDDAGRLAVVTHRPGGLRCGLYVAVKHSTVTIVFAFAFRVIHVFTSCSLCWGIRPPALLCVSVGMLL